MTAAFDGVDLGKLRTTVIGHYPDGCCWHGLAYPEYLDRIVARSTKLATTYTMPYDEPRIPDHLDEISTCIIASWMHELTEKFAYSFEQLTDLGGYMAAGVVSQLSPDLRLPISRRNEERIERLSSGHWRAQVVELAVLLTQVEIVRTEPWNADTGAKFAEIRSWTQYADKRLAAILRLTDQPVLKAYFKDVKNKLQAIQEDGRFAAERMKLESRYNSERKTPFPPRARLKD